MTIPPGLVEALRAPLCTLLPDRSQARAGGLTEPGGLVDLLDLGGGAVVALLASDQRLVVVPALWDGRRLRRDAGVARHLVAGRVGAFTVEILGAPLPKGTMAASLPVDQSNDSVVLEDAVVAKWQLDATVSPAPARLRTLRVSGLTPTPRAIVEWESPSGRTLTLLTAADYVAESQDGWTWAVQLVRDHGCTPPALEPFTRLGRMTAQMHTAFAGLGVARWTARDCAAMRERAQADLDAARTLMDGEEGARLCSRVPAVERRLDVWADIAQTPTIAVHGDYHVGQVLRDPEGRLLIIDFDGNPVLAAEERMQPWPAALDVAGMLASIDHVARVVTKRTAGVEPHVASTWIRCAQRDFLAAYRDALERDDIFDQRLLAPLLVHQELREYIYAGRHLPHWRYVPDQALGALLRDEEDHGR